MAADGAEQAAAKEAIIAMLRAYNAAETEAAETLEFTIIAPFLDPDGPFYTEMIQEWALGTMTIRDNEATVVTQEVWSNMERRHAWIRERCGRRSLRRGWHGRHQE